MPQIHPQTSPLPFYDHRSHLIHPSSTEVTEPTDHPKRHLGPISRFATVHFWTNRQTYTHEAEGAGLGVNFGRPIVTNGDFVAQMYFMYFVNRIYNKDVTYFLQYSFYEQVYLPENWQKDKNKYKEWNYAYSEQEITK